MPYIRTLLFFHSLYKSLHSLTPTPNCTPPSTPAATSLTFMDISVYTPSQSPWITCFSWRRPLLWYCHLLWLPCFLDSELRPWICLGFVIPMLSSTCMKLAFTSAFGHSGHGIQPPEQVLKVWMWVLRTFDQGALETGDGANKLSFPPALDCSRVLSSCS